MSMDSKEATNKMPAQLGHSMGHRPVVIGLYGVQGCGKTYLLNRLKQEIGESRFKLYDGSDMIADCAGSLEEFKKLEEKDKVRCRQLAIDQIREDCVRSGKAAIVAGHFMLWSEKAGAGSPIYTQNDLDTYTHILYLDVPASYIEERRSKDTARSRPSLDTSQLKSWQEAEKSQLCDICRKHGILFSLISTHDNWEPKPEPELVKRVSMLLNDFKYHNEKDNLNLATLRLDEALLPGRDQLETIVVLDADKTLAAKDTGGCSGRSFPGLRNRRSKVVPSRNYSMAHLSTLTLLFARPC